MTTEPMSIKCLVCAGPVYMGVTKTAKGLHFKCVKNGKHFRGFIMDRDYVDGVLARLRDIEKSDDE